MNKKRSEYIYCLTGFVKNKYFKIVNGRPCYRLSVDLNQKEIQMIQVFEDLLSNKKVLKELEASDYVGKKYLFQNYFGIYRLVDWEESKKTPN